jgi:hypothetical protein
VGAVGWAVAGLLVGTALAGFGFGAANTPVNFLSMSTLPAEVSGAAGSMASAARQLGQSVGTALAAVLIGLGAQAAVAARSAAASAAGSAAGAEAPQGYLLAAAAVGVIAVLMFLIPGLYPRQGPDPDPNADSR